MNFEKDIPDYAMVPAKEIQQNTIEPITTDALYTPVEITNITEGSCLNIVLEEDILVPDIKPDLKEILIMDGSCNLSTREIFASDIREEYINLTGKVHLQTIYLPEKPSKQCPLVSISTTIPFKEPWPFTNASSVEFDCSIDKIEYSIVNERKYRAKVTLTICPKVYVSKSVNIFDGLSKDNLHVLREPVDFSYLTTRKKDVISLKEYISPIDDTMPGSILMKTLQVLENYKQITADKVIISGYICLNILYCNKSPINDSTASDNIHQVQQKVEFTQFIPIKNSSSLDHCKVSFDSSKLEIKIVQHEDGQDILCLEGDLTTYVKLFKKIQKEVIVDGYHRDKNFVFDFDEIESNTLLGTIEGESSVREIFVPNNLKSDIGDILFTTGAVEKYTSKFEQGKLLCEGTILAKIVCCLSNDDNDIVTIKQSIPFRLAANTSLLNGDELLLNNIYLKDFWSEKINGKQLEFNATIFSRVDAIKSTSFKLLTNPAFETGCEKNSVNPMVIYACKKGDTLWQIAKRFKTCTDNIKEINQLDGDFLQEGEKLLIIK